MPSILQLEGSRLGRLGAIPVRNTTTLLGATDTVMAHPIAVIVGLVIGGWFAYSHTSPLALIWGDGRMRQSRARSLHGRRHKR